MKRCCPDEDKPESMRKSFSWFVLFTVIAATIFCLTSWLLPKLEEAHRPPTPKIRVEPLQEHESHPINRLDLDRG